MTKGDTEQYEDAICPGCETILTGSREPGDRDYCQDTEREVTLEAVEPAQERDSK